MAGSGGFEPQSKPPVHTGGFDYCSMRETMVEEPKSKHKNIGDLK
ncbi:hypothetical protein [Enterococcus raffinosus]|nr:hypothetical protein [Enterococcus raffinosus]